MFGKVPRLDVSLCSQTPMSFLKLSTQSSKQTSWSRLSLAARYTEMEFLIILPAVAEFSVT